VECGSEEIHRWNYFFKPLIEELIVLSKRYTLVEINNEKIYVQIGPGFPPFEKFKYGHFRKI
jgi:hypothetical protein